MHHPFVSSWVVLLLVASCWSASDYGFLLHLVPSHIPLGIPTKFSIEVIDLYGPVTGLTSLPVFVTDPDSVNVTDTLQLFQEIQAGLYTYDFVASTQGTYELCVCPSFNCSIRQYCIQIDTCAQTTDKGYFRVCMKDAARGSWVTRLKDTLETQEVTPGMRFGCGADSDNVIGYNFDCQCRCVVRDMCLGDPCDSLGSRGSCISTEGSYSCSCSGLFNNSNNTFSETCTTYLVPTTGTTGVQTTGTTGVQTTGTTGVQTTGTTAVF